MPPFFQLGKEELEELQLPSTGYELSLLFIVWQVERLKLRS